METRQRSRTTRFSPNSAKLTRADLLRTPASFEEHHIEVARTARYYTLGDPAASNAWIVCHGYSQLAGVFIRYFEPLLDLDCYVVAPEGLNRFYPSRWSKDPHEARKVGATWMTREDRLTDIDDYVRYIERIRDDVVGDRSGTVTALGFSQGCATVSRWVAELRPRLHRLVLWGETIPPDMDMERFSAASRDIDLVYVIGTTDEFIPDSRVEAEARRLDNAGIGYRLVRFDGGHQLNRYTLVELASQ